MVIFSRATHRLTGTLWSEWAQLISGRNRSCGSEHSAIVLPISRGSSHYHEAHWVGSSGESGNVCMVGGGGGAKDTQLSSTTARGWMGAELLLYRWKRIPDCEQRADRSELVWDVHCGVRVERGFIHSVTVFPLLNISGRFSKVHARFLSSNASLSYGYYKGLFFFDEKAEICKTARIN